MLRKPVFWIALAAVSLGSIFFSVRYFPRAFPIVTLDLRMNRDQALARAAELASRFQFPPSDYRRVASFSGDQEVQNFIELEAGGTAAFQAMMSAGHYHPYKWRVRLFRPGEMKETVIQFTPRGDPYGFAVKLPENEAGAALESERAREIAELAAARDWQVNLGNYQLVEKSQEVRPGGRIDHTFVYERPDIQLGEGRYRLRLVLGGDRLTGLTRTVKVPEAFSRRYEQMRSSNDAVGAAGSMALLLLYLIGGCVIGLFFLLRQRWILWRKPLLWGVFIAFLQLLAGINEWPLIWMTYDTAISSQGFVLQQILQLLLGFLGYTALFAISFTAAESLTRRAFPNHIQLWRLWSPDVAASKAVLGRTVGGYLLVAVFFAYEVLLYFIAGRALGWWTPSDALVQPDVLAAYFPWLSSIAVSAQAGFWEETLFRAVPIAGAALLGTRFGGRRGWWIAGAMVVQAIIFGSGHAGYATQPYYARLVELIIPSFMFGGLYLCFGLLPAIVLHFTFDVVWFALPLFVSTAPGIWLNRALVILFTFMPLWIVLATRWRARAWIEIKDSDLNQSWQPAEAPKPEVAADQPAPSSMDSRIRRYLPLAGALGLVLWGIWTHFHADSPPMNRSRAEAQAIAVQAMEQHGLRAPGSWKMLTVMDGEPGQQDRFVWQTAGKETYGRLIDGYLDPPHWIVRFAKFEGDVAERAEEYRVYVSGSGRVFRFVHILPEAAAAPSISEDEARVLAHEAIRKDLQSDVTALKEVSAVPSKFKARTDWEFTYTAAGEEKLPQGERRIGVAISGDKVVDVRRYVHVSEEWSRQERDRQTIPEMLSAGCTIVLAAIVLGGIVIAIVSWSRKRFVVSSFLLLSTLLLIVNVASLLNSLPAMTGQFSTAQPFQIQWLVAAGAGLLGMMLFSVGMGLIAGLDHQWCRSDEPSQPRSAWLTGLSLGAFAAGILAFASSFNPSLAPKWANYSALNSYAPLLSWLAGPVSGYFTQSLTLLFVFAGLNHLTRRWTQSRISGGVLLFLFGFVIAGYVSIETIPSWLIRGVIAGGLLLAMYVLVLRYSARPILIIVAVMQILGLAKQGAFAATPMSVPSSAAAAVLIGLAAWSWHKWRGPAPQSQ